MENENALPSNEVSYFINSLSSPKEDLPTFQEISSNYSKILILGALGFIGKNFFEYINNLNIFSSIILADKSLPEISHIPSHKKHNYLQNPKVKFYQIDLCSEKQVRKIFLDHPDIDVIVNLASETRLSLSEEDYCNRCEKLPVLCGKLAVEFQIKKFIQISCCKIYKSASSSKSKENSDIDPWDIRYVYMNNGEKELKNIKDLNYILLRAACVYGPYDFNGEMALRLVSCFIYKELKEKMKVMWDGGLKLNTINVIDVCRAILYSINKCKRGDVYNLVDENDSDQNKIHKVFKELFKINIDCVGSVRSYLVKLTFERVIQTLNEKHLQRWFELCAKYKIMNSPMNVIVYRENLLGNSLWVDGEGFKQKTGFKCIVPLLEVKYFKALVNDYIENGYLPPIY